MSNKKLIIIGLDGATFTLLKPWSEEGLLPNLKKFTDEGSSGVLLSTIPPSTGPAWPAVATGQNQGRCGTYFFFNKKNNSYETSFIHSSQIRGKCFWDYLGSYGKKVGILAYPMLYPTYEIDGFMVAGLGSEKSEYWTYPRALREEINQVSPDYVIQIPLVGHQEDKLLADISSAFESQKKVANYLLKKDWDCFVYVLSMTDWVQHVFWKYMDPSNIFYDEKSASVYLGRIKEMYKKFDAFIGTILSQYPEANVFLLSDHGFGDRTSDFNLKGWLEKNGYLVRKKTSGTGTLKTQTYSTGQKVASWLKLKQRFPKLMEKVVPAARYNLSPMSSDVDFEKSKAYVLEAGIFINLKGREVHGFVEPEEFEGLKQEITQKLLALKDEFPTIQDVTVHEGSKIYYGEKAHLAPDLIPVIDHWASTYSNTGYDGTQKSIFKPFNADACPEVNGTHRSQGIFMAYGPDIQKGQWLGEKDIIDVMPTVLLLFGVPVPQNVDGKAMSELFSPNSQFCGATPQKEAAAPKLSPLQANKLNALKKQLRAKKE